jgi:hypothetical protein
MWYVRIRREMDAGFWWENPRRRDSLEDLCVGGRVILKWILKKRYKMAWTGSRWLKVGKSVGLFETK